MRRSVFPKAAPDKSAAQKCPPLIGSDDAGNWSVDHGMRARAGRRGAVLVVAIMSALATVLAAYYGWQYGLLVTDGVTTRILAIRVERQVAGRQEPDRRSLSILRGLRVHRRQRPAAERPAIDRSRSCTRRWPAADTLPRSTYGTAAACRGVNTIDLRALRTAFSVLSVLAMIGWAAVAVGWVRHRRPPDDEGISGPRATRRARRAAAASPAPTGR